MYPVNYAADYDLGDRNRLTTAFRIIVSIPWLIVEYFYGIAAYIVGIVAWFAIVFTGRYPEGLYNFNVKFLRFAARASGFGLLLTDEYPPFNGDPHPSYPVRADYPEPLPAYDRLKTGLRLIFGIPVMFLLFVASLVGLVFWVVAWFSILFTGKASREALGRIAAQQTYAVRAGAYFFLLTEDWPPFSLDPVEPTAQQLPASAAPATPVAPATPEAEPERPPGT